MHPGGLGMVSQFLAVGLGGAVGAMARFWISEHLIGARGHPHAGFPWGTLVVNALGSACLGALMAFVLRGEAGDRQALRLAIGVGLLGSMTTFSTFSYETLQLFRAGRVWTAGGSVVANVTICVTFASAAWWFLSRPHGPISP